MSNPEEEFDYLSDELLAQCEKQDIRPGLLKRHGEKRKFEQYKKQIEIQSNKKRILKPDEKLKEDLKKKIPEDNKGFLMLQKMGFKPGTSIGKPGKEGIREPVEIELKSNRLGLGHKIKRQENRKIIDEWKERREELTNANDFRARFSSEKILKLTYKDLKSAQSACHTFDTQNGIEKPLEEWYWNLEKPKEDEEESAEEESKIEEDEEIDEIPPQDKLEKLINYLKSNYFYCIWCGIKYEDTNDMNLSCPGNTRDDH